MTGRVVTLLALAQRYGGWLAIAPVPLWLLFHVAIEPEAAWVARYVSANASEPPITRFEIAVSHYWTGKKETLDIPPVEPKNLEATFDTCMSLDAAIEIPVMLVASGAARLFIDEQLLLEIEQTGEHVTRGKIVQLAAGIHHVHVEFTARSNPIVGALASFDDGPPRPIGSGTLKEGVRTFRPQASSRPCKP